jgi:hypothetical protein
VVVLAITGLVLAVIILLWLRALAKKHGPGALAFRFAAGRHLDGVRRTDATWSAAATRVLHPTGRASGWAHLPERTRAAIRLAALTLAGAETALWLKARPAAPPLTIALMLAMAGAVGWHAWRRIERARHHREVISPAAAALAPFLGTTPRNVEAGLKIRRDYADANGGEHIASLALPDHYAATPDQKAKVMDIMANRLGVDLKPHWQTSRYPMVLTLHRAPTPPSMVRFATQLARIEALPPDKIMLGIAADGQPRDWDRSAEDPAIAFHGGSRRGKTNLLLLIAAQEIRKWRHRPPAENAPACAAGRVTYIDPKQVSAMVLAGLPGVDLCNQGARDIPGMWAGAARFAQLVNDRYDALAEDNTLEFQDSLLIIDELSMFSGMSARHWAATRERTDPAEPPVWADLATVVWMGAQVRARAIVAGQRLDFRILAGLLGSFGIRLLAGFLPQDYMRLVGVLPVPRSQKPRGRFLLFAGDEPEWIQAPFAKPEEYRSWVLADDREPAVDLARSTSYGTWVTGHAAAAQYLELSIDAFRQRIKRQGRPDGELRVGNQPAWRPADLDRWAGRGEQIAAAATAPGQAGGTTTTGGN